jgi:uncharacterized protein involved in tolerance to divalent cations
MVLLHIIVEEMDQALEIADFLVKEKLILNAVILEKVIARQAGEDGSFQSQNQILIMGKTKALLFNSVDEQLRAKYPQNMPVLYSLPIVNMDWEQSNELIQRTAKV